MKQEYQEIKIPAFEFDEYMKLLSVTSPIEEDRGIEIYACFTATFSNKWEMDIKVCGGGEDSTPFVDYILYDEQGAEVCIVDVKETLEELFTIPYEDTQYIVKCISVPNPVKSNYEDGVCPDCQEDIPDDIVEGGECDNCGHVFYSD